MSSRFGSVAETFCNNRRQGVWVPAFAGTTKARIYLLALLPIAATRHIISGMPSRFTFVPYPDCGLVRLRVTPDEPAEGPPAIIEQRPRGSRRPHTDMAFAKVT